MDLEKLDFGAPAAERDIDCGLDDYFVESDAFQRVTNGEKTILLGNRGSGKSAIFKVLASRERKKGTLVLELNPENYSYEMLASTMLKESDGAWAKHGAYASAWKYLIYVSIMKGITIEGRKLKTGSAAKIYNYLRDHHQGVADNPLSVLISYLKRIEGVKIGSYGANLRANELEKLYKLEEIQLLFPHLNELCAKRRVLVFIDELDRGWDSSEDAKAFVAGLFQASISINQQTSNIKVYISLRRELYDSIPELYEDAQKYRDIIETINWDEETINWDEPSLLSLITNRIKHSVPSLATYNNESCWNAIFEEVLRYRQSRSFNYMVDRTLYRPREIIQFCTEALQMSKQQSNFPIDYSVISQVEISYSEERTKDIAAEYRFPHPGLLSIFEVFRGKAYNFDRNELELLCLGMIMDEHHIDVNAKNWLKDQDYEYLIEILWRIGFLRAQAVGGVKAMRRSGSSYLGPHQVSQLNLRNIHRFHVHPMFRSFLAMKEQR